MRHRLAAVALCGLLASLPTHGQQVSDARSGNAAGHESPGAQAASAPSVDLSGAILPALERIARAQEAQAANGKTADEKQRESEDLAAQKDMAFWAKAMFWATMVAVIVGGLNIALLIYTLGETRRSAKAAIRSAAAARLAVRNARRSDEAQLRAYVWRDTHGIQDHFERNDSLYRAEFFIRNGGQTPAHEIRTWVRMQALPTNLPAAHIFEQPNDADFEELPKVYASPGSYHTQSVTFRAPDSGTDLELAQGLQALYQWGVIKYKDVFGTEWKTRFRLRLLIWSKPDGTPMGIWTYCHEGNDAT